MPASPFLPHVTAGGRTMHIEFLVEEPSAEAALNNIVPRIIGARNTFRVHPHQGKQDLLKSLPKRLRGYARWLPADWRIVVLVDEDREDCRQLKARLELAAFDAGLTTRGAAGAASRIQVVNRIAVEELEAWLLGDGEAVRAAYPRVSKTFETRAKYRHPDAITGGTWEALEQLLQRAGYVPGGLAKVSVASSISRHMDPSRNRSSSFAVFHRALAELVGA